MNRPEPHPVELLLLAGLVALEAVAVLAAALVALVAAITRPRPSGFPARVTPPPPAPLLHPLALVAEQLEAMPVTRLRSMAGVTIKRHRKAELIAMVAAMA